ncbi:MAG TPA: hypothetical protein VE843_09135 [Ktedonobacteraceae bacterium]|nr:hypothetical protein [Ktedonobacteraceae bacterium]
MMYQIQDGSEDEFHSEDLVLWYAHDDKRALPIPGVVVRQQEYNVVIRTRVDGTIREIAVSPDELVKR